jgi:hypothetical protein
MNQRSYNNENNQCELSYELLHLLKWLLEHESSTLKKIIARAVRSGLREQLSTNNPLNGMNSESIQNSIIDFLDLLDFLLHEAISDNSLRKALEQNLMPAVHKIDSNVCDRATVQGSLDKTTDHLEHFPNANAKELLYKELLKRWKPSKKKIQN